MGLNGSILMGRIPLTCLQVNVEQHRYRLRVAAQPFFPADTQLKQTELPMARVPINNQPSIEILDHPAPQAHEPQIGDHYWQQQSCKAIAVGYATAIPVKATTLPVAEHRFDPHCAGRSSSRKAIYRPIAHPDLSPDLNIRSGESIAAWIACGDSTSR
jgi:hypothetical protein